MSLPSARLGGLYSFPRFALVAFPCLVALAVLGRDRRVNAGAVAVLAAGLAVGVVRWALWYWVA
jgi:Fe2+ transport system protein B